VLGNGRHADVKIGFRYGWLRSVAVGLGGASVAAIVMGGYKILETQPSEAFALLRSWGPNPLIEISVVVVFGTLLQQFVEIAKQGVEAQRDMAEAMTKIAEKDDRQLQEIQTLSAYTATQAERMHRRTDRMSNLLAQIAESMKIPVQNAGDEED